ncbi:MAG TPA: NAD(P)/FAD-dependent oxidoreductase, partial [Candidatus Eisenbacteria bacterium]|nr:NAD(P)/FAD-dependent oxidoreductase [Candidatus Eisenbacteria bacterium]
EFDLIVIGTGTAASTAALACRSVGWKVAIIDSLPFGGTCALRGCEVLVEASKTIDSSKRHENKGITGSESIRIKWSDLIRFKRTFTEPFPEEIEDSYVKAGIIPFHGPARFIGSNMIKVGHDGNNRILNSRFILIATGAMPMNLNIPGLENITTSDQFLKIEGDNLPNRIVFVGGGYISFEFAHIAARAGAEVTILHRGKQSLERFDPDLVNQLVQKSREIGIDVQVQKIVRGIDKTSDGKLVVHASDTFAGDDKVSITLETDMVVHGAGRVPNIEGLDLTTAGVEHNITGVKVNEYLQSVSNPAVYAAGDVAASGGSPLTPVASYDGHIVANNLTKGNTLKANCTGLPSVVFTTPPLASVGRREQEAKEQGIRFKTKYKNTSSWYSSRRVGETCSGFKVLIEEESTRILGAHILGPNAEEVINIFSIAIRLGLTAKHLNDPILYAFPTNSSDVLYML